MRSIRPALVALISIVLIGAGCANDPPPTAAGDDAVRDQAVAFATCMRENGIAGFPDPDASGQLTIDAVANGSSVDPSTAAFEQALAACKELEPPGFTGPGVATPEQQDGRLAFARCIRENGVPDFPDPAPDAPLVDTNKIPSAATDGGMTILNGAMEACRDFGPDLQGAG